jgi:glucokinase
MQQKMEKLLTLGVDLGGTKVETALVDASGKIISSHRYPTNPEKGALRIIDDVVGYVEECLDKGEEDAQALGIGVAAQVDHSGVVLSSPNLGWQNVPLRAMLEEKLKLPVVVTNDVRAASWGEWHFGAGKGVDDLVVVFVGTGIGGGVVSGGRMLEGCSNTAGEIGHATLIVEGRNCRCPNKGCLEAYAGGWAIAERAQEAVQANPEEGKALISLAGGVEKITAALVSQAYHEGDVLSSKLVKETTQYLSAGLVSIVNSFNPCLLVFGGGVVDGLPELIKTAEPFIKKRALRAAAQNLKVVKAALGNEAGIVGAAALAQDHLKETV